MIKIDKVGFAGIVNPYALGPVYNTLHPVSYEFEFNKSYMLNGSKEGGAWALSWIIGGLLEPTGGIILKENLVWNIQERLSETWCVRHSEIKRFGIFRNQPVSWQIRHGLRTREGQKLWSEADIVNIFHLTPERYHRRWRHLGNEVWRASPAIGFSNGKRIFCFPWLDQDLIETYYNLWLKEMIDFLCKSGALVLIPAQLTNLSKTLCDNVVSL
jgi:hypothetical protein